MSKVIRNDRKTGLKLIRSNKRYHLSYKGSLSTGSADLKNSIQDFNTNLDHLRNLVVIHGEEILH